MLFPLRVPVRAPGSLEIHVVDVGQGDAVVVISPAGFVTLFDAGPEGAAGAVSAYLSGLGITGVDYTVVSHMHADHVGGMDLALLDHPETVSCFDHGGSFATLEYDEYNAAAGSRRTVVGAGSTIDMGPGVLADVLSGHTGDANENLNSVVLRITHGTVTFLMGGDCEGPCEAMLGPGPVQIYKVHHHGASDSSTSAFLDRIDPWTGLISVGAGNAFGHPHVEALNRLAVHETRIYRTDLDGNLAVISDGALYTVNGQPVCSPIETRTCGDTNVGACQLGQRPCNGGTWGTCQGAINPVTEVCDNGLDDDCDGFTDGADADCGAPADHLVISQVGYDTPGDDALEEFVDLFNPGDSAVSLDGWSLSDNAGTWAFPNGVNLAPGAHLSIARNTAGFQALYSRNPDVAGLSLGLSNSGDALSLVDDIGAEVDHLAWEGFEPGWDIEATTGSSVERADPSADSDSVADWSVTTPAVPRGGGSSQSTCGDGVCDPGEDCVGCSADCIGVTKGRSTNRYCCGNLVCESVGEDAGNCAVDCG